jgi:FkbM family methyltransferase
MQTAFAKSVGPGSVVWDVGSHVGFFTLMASVLSGDEGRVVAFEPSRRNLAYLKKHVEINQLRNVTVIEAAVSDSHGSRAFDSGESSFSGSLSRAGEYVVSTVRLDDLYEAGTIPQPDVINMDIERAEVAALTGARKLIDDCRPTIFLETHSPEAHSGCLALLRGSGYAIELLDTAFYKIRRQQIVAMPTSRIKGDRDEIRT